MCVDANLKNRSWGAFVADSNVSPEIDSQKRRSTRIVQAVPLTVTGVDALGRPFQERTSTLIINCHGCRYQSKHYVLKNMWVTFEVPHNEAGQEPRSVRARVSWIQRPRTVRELFQIGVELEVTGNVWGIAFPPGDWFSFPEPISNQDIPVTVAPAEIPSPRRNWNMNASAAAELPEQPEDNVRVLPMPGGTDASLQLARQLARLVAEAKQQVQGTVQEAAARTVAAETRPLLASLQSQLNEAAQKSVASAISAQLERIQNASGERDVSVAAMRSQWSAELDQRLAEARQQIDSKLAEVERARRADFEGQIQSQLQAAIEKFQNLTGNLDANSGEMKSTIDRLRLNSEVATATELRRWQELMDQRASEAQARIAHLEGAAKRLGEKIAAETSAAEAGWRGLLEADVAAASTRWNEKIEASLETASRQVSERLARSNEAATRQLEQQLQQRIGMIGNAFSQATAEAESSLGTLRAAIGKEAGKGQEAVSQLQKSFEEVEVRKAEISAHALSASQELARRGEALLDAQSAEMNRRAEVAAEGMTQRLQPVLESAGHQAIERLANELDQRFAPQIARATEILSRLALDQDKAEKALGEHQQKLWQTSERSVQDSVARAKEVLAEVEKEFGESSRNSSTKWLTELETRAAETTHTTFEALFKSAEWYEKKIQTQMQSTMEKGLEQATATLREKARDFSALFATELDHYSRSYVEHSQTQMEENARDAAERGGRQLAQAGDTAAASFTGRAEQLTHEQFELFNAKAKSAFEQNAARLEAHTVQVRSKLEGDARTLVGEFGRVLSQQTQKGLAQARVELNSQTEIAKDNLRVEAQSLDRQLRTSMQSAGSNALDDYKQRLENASNSWLLTTVSRLTQQSEGLIDQLAKSTEERLRASCNSVFADLGETLRQKLAGLVLPASAQQVSTNTSTSSKLPEIKSEEQK
jgi:hypothetical protein